jgi:hypothetical protein
MALLEVAAGTAVPDKALVAQASSELNALEEELNKIIAWFVKGQASGTADSTAPARADRLHASTRTVNRFC